MTVYVTEDIWEALNVWPFDLSIDDMKTYQQNDFNIIIFKNTGLRLKYMYAISGLVEIMTQYANNKVHPKFTWSRSV